MICPYCRARVDDAGHVACTRCGTALHTECAALHGRCVVFGCRGHAFGPRRDRQRRLATIRRDQGPLASALTAASRPLDDLTLALVGLAGALGLLLLLGGGAAG